MSVGANASTRLPQLVAATESDLRVVEALKKRYSFEEWYKSITPPLNGGAWSHLNEAKED